MYNIFIIKKKKKKKKIKKKKKKKKKRLLKKKKIKQNNILWNKHIKNIYIGSIAFRHNLCIIIYSCITMWLIKINE